jgi:predicted MPP superfamily phosphohydrolase
MLIDGALEIGLWRPLLVREERLTDRPDACRLVYASDIHLRRGRAGTLRRQVLEAVAAASPDLVLLGGDLVDQRSQLGELTALVAAIREVAIVLAVGGNHDRRVGLDRVRGAVEHGGGLWIHAGTAVVTRRGRAVAVSGPEATDPVDGHVRVLCGHDPWIWRACRHGGFDLVLAGHLHGCQVVACHYRDRLLPGALVYPYCVLGRRRGQSRLVVSRGVSDLVPLRWRCPREVVLCHV